MPTRRNYSPPSFEGIASFHLSGLHHTITQLCATRRSMRELGPVISRLGRDAIRPGEGKQVEVGRALRLTRAHDQAQGGRNTADPEVSWEGVDGIPRDWRGGP
jgi:transposase InsO family protein